jgi:hypothetical protein
VEHVNIISVQLCSVNSFGVIRYVSAFYSAIYLFLFLLLDKFTVTIQIQDYNEDVVNTLLEEYKQ